MQQTAVKRNTVNSKFSDRIRNLFKDSPPKQKLKVVDTKF